MASLSRLEALFLDVTSYALDNNVHLKINKQTNKYINK